MSVYPGTLDTFTEKENKQDIYDAQHINDLQDAIVAIQTELGTDPAGSVVDLKTRLFVSLDNDGALRHGTSFPASPINGQPFWRTDQNKFYIYNGTTWQAITITSSIFKVTPNNNPASGNFSFDEVFDTNNDFASDTFTCSIAGKYALFLKFEVTASGTDVFAKVDILLNGVDIAESEITLASLTDPGEIVIATIVDLEEGDEITVENQSTADITGLSDEARSWFCGHFIQQ